MAYGEQEIGFNPDQTGSDAMSLKGSFTTATTPVDQMGPGMQQQLASVMNPNEPSIEINPELIDGVNGASLLPETKVPMQQPSASGGMFGELMGQTMNMVKEAVAEVGQQLPGHKPEAPQAEVAPANNIPDNTIFTARATAAMDMTPKAPGSQFG